MSKLAYKAQGNTGLELAIPSASSGSFTGVSCFAVPTNTSPLLAIALKVSSSSAQITGLLFHSAENTIVGNKKIKKVVMCSGKIYYDLLEAREKFKNSRVVLVRLEQLYPFPAKTLANILKRYKNANFLWCQEEPKNMGAWNTVRNYIDRTLEMINFKDINVKYVGRQASSSTATGNANKHLAQQKEILEKILK